jgi:glycosyltransferase involved in cell wall biosynthesis
MLVLSSDREGFPNILLEAMAARIPVVATPAGDIQEVVREGVTGYVVPFDDVEGIAKRMVRLAKSPDLRHQLGEAGRQQAERIYSYEGLADRLLSTYRSIAEQQGNRRVLRALSSGSHIQKVAQATSFEYSSK